MRQTAIVFLIALATLTTCASSTAPRFGYHLVPGSFEAHRGPDGNSVFLDAPDGLILVDTGRHPEHRDHLLAYARARGRPIVAIFNTHWHLDHSTGNADLRSAYPAAPLYASQAIDGALRNFLRTSREQAEAALRTGRVAPDRMAEVRRFLSVMDAPDSLQPTAPVTRSADMQIGGRQMRVNLAPFAATEGDVWIHDPAADLVIAGDLVVAPVPFFDTACPDGWRQALDQIAATRWSTLIPGHGAPMSRADFARWRSAFNGLLDCAGSSASREACIAGWRTAGAPFRPADGERVDRMVGHYLDTRLRAAPPERNRYCPARRAMAS